jgi:hypothetical protein
MHSHPLRSPLALARRPPALDGQPNPRRLYTVGGYLAHEHADVIRHLTARRRRSRSAKVLTLGVRSTPPS